MNELGQEASRALAQSQAEIVSLLKDFTASANTAGALTEVFGSGINVARAEELIESVTTEFEDKEASQSEVAIEILPSAEINNAAGAFSAETNTIYLSEEFLAENASNPDAIAKEVIDGVSHFVDSEANN